MDYVKIILIGNATDAAKLHRAEGKTSYVDLTLACRRNREQSDFFPVRCFGNQVELADAEQVEKGTRLLVEGRIEINRFVPEEGEPRTAIRVVADIMRILYQPGQRSSQTSGG